MVRSSVWFTWTIPEILGTLSRSRIHPTMPYFVFGPVPQGSVNIRPGMPYRALYRIITFDGEPDPEQIENWYLTFAKSGAP